MVLRLKEIMVCGRVALLLLFMKAIAAGEQYTSHGPLLLPDIHRFATDVMVQGFTVTSTSRHVFMVAGTLKPERLITGVFHPDMVFDPVLGYFAIDPLGEINVGNQINLHAFPLVFIAPIETGCNVAQWRY